ncbi:uncharacterized protein LY89DRAFT_673099 [Mollisia scopiformis]|uniref:Uncharacterized protein n=1 Tax=Mollisia scopiformis TaxID=149040 RepID=A0A194WYH5_MOLSC|nr:uncharacterized protein LY89DRAFT_673099 [Mollisia scopiformis]KUJ12995.1 hypothetical protein LY89DRAFT_673099 [Mollisia scopiformis]
MECGTIPCIPDLYKQSNFLNESLLLPLGLFTLSLERHSHENHSKCHRILLQPLKSSIQPQLSIPPPRATLQSAQLVIIQSKARLRWDIITRAGEVRDKQENTIFAVREKVLNEESKVRQDREERFLQMRVGLLIEEVSLRKRLFEARWKEKIDRDESEGEKLSEAKRDVPVANEENGLDKAILKDSTKVVDDNGGT